MKMKYLDTVRLIRDKPEYAEEGLHAGDTCVIWLPEIRDNLFYVFYDNKETDYEKYECWETCVDVADVELVEDYGLTDAEVAEALPSDEPWWCIVEDGFIKNALGEKKNKVAYDYDS